MLSCYWDKEISGQLTSGAGLSKTTEQMKDPTTFIGWNDGSWIIDSGNDYPRLYWENMPGSPITTPYPDATYIGSGTELDPFVVSASEDLVNMSMRPMDWDKCFSVSNDIDMEGVIYVPVSEFTGTFNGNENTIKNLTIVSEEIGQSIYLGLFGKLSGGKVSNVNLEDVTISGVDNCIGALAGKVTDWEIVNCTSSGTIKGYMYVGGLIGSFYNGSMSGCSSTCNISVTQYAGGLAGQGQDSVFYDNHTSCIVSGTTVGGLIGNLIDNSDVNNCNSTGQIIGGGCGGLLGKVTNSSISNCHFIGEVAGDGQLGGLIGYVVNSDITNSYTLGEVEGSGNKVGGMVGYNQNGDFENCFSYSSVAGFSSVGGLIGISEKGDITHCFSSGSLASSYSFVGGLVGHSVEDNIKDCYSRSMVNAYRYAGGLIGRADGSFFGNSYSSGKVLCLENGGGLVAYGSATIDNSFWDKESSGQLSSIGGIGKTMSEMKDVNTFLNAGWDISTSGGGSAVWQMRERDYPIFPWDIQIPDVKGLTINEAEADLDAAGFKLGSISYAYDALIPKNLIVSQDIEFITPVGSIFDSLVNITVSLGVPFEGDGTAGSPYLIADLAGFEYFLENEKYHQEGVYTKLIADIARLDKHLTNKIYLREAGYHTFWGVFDGGNHKIKNYNLTIQGNLGYYNAGVTGLFPVIARTGVVKNLILEDVYVESNTYDVGGLCGRNWGIIENCHVSGYVYSSGYASVGLLLANNAYNISYTVEEEPRIVRNCSVRGVVETSSDFEMFAGGLCGANEGLIANCYAEADVSGTRYVGSFCGWNDSTAIGKIPGKIINCYSTGHVSGSLYVGGFVGFSKWPVVNCYCSAMVESTATSKGGFAGSGLDIFENCFWDIDVSAMADGVGDLDPDPAGVVGLTAAEMQEVDTFLDVGWDFVYENVNGAEEVWYMDGYPALYWSKGDVFDIEEVEYLAANWLADGCDFGSFCYYFDYNDDGKIDLADFAIIAGGWLEEVFLKEFLDPCLEGYWKLDEVIGSYAEDLTSYNRDGIVYGMPVRGVGKVEGCYEFDGADDYIRVGTYDGVGGSGARTVSAWIKADEDLADADKSYHVIVSWGQAWTGKKWLFMLDADTGQLALSTYNGKLIGGDDLEDGLWHHVAVVLPDGADNINQVKLYVDGVEISTNAASLDSVIDTVLTEPAMIGASDTDPAGGIQSPGFFFKGSMDEVRIYNVGLSGAEIAELN